MRKRHGMCLLCALLVMSLGFNFALMENRNNKQRFIKNAQRRKLVINCADRQTDSQRSEQINGQIEKQYK